MNYSLNVKSSSIVHTLLSNCVKLLGKVQKLLIQFINYLVISKRIRVVSPKFYTVRKNFTGPPVPPVPTNLESDHTLLPLQSGATTMFPIVSSSPPRISLASIELKTIQVGGVVIENYLIWVLQPVIFFVLKFGDAGFRQSYSFYDIDKRSVE